MNLITSILEALFGKHGGVAGPLEKAVTIKKIAPGDYSAVVGMLQMQLVNAGHVLQVDDDFGTITGDAVRAFQAAHHLPATGVVDVYTARALDLIPVRPSQPQPGSILKDAPWLSRMRAITGTKELPGSANSPIIMSWRTDIAKTMPILATYASTYTGDSIPWCGFGGGWCMVMSGIMPPFGAQATQKFMWADAWHAPNWGQKLDEPLVGCVMTFTRNGGGHVAFLEKMDGKYCYIRGCNQSDMVNVTRKSMDQFTAATWPPGVPIVRNIQGVITNAISAGKEN